jgi:hypothetical protein
VCTVSVVPVHAGFRIVCNRDERRSRPVALPPGITAIGTRRAIVPVDPVSGGTWIGANDTGLALVLLNRSLTAVPRGHDALQSRGSIIPLLLSHARLRSAVDAALELRPIAFEPFQVIAIQGDDIAIVTSDRRFISAVVTSLVGPLVCASSSCGDHLVEAPRAALFKREVVDLPSADWPLGQQRFHSHRWDAHPERSVVMSRSDARTVSRTTLDIRQRVVTVRYELLDDASSISRTELRGVA